MGCAIYSPSEVQYPGDKCIDPTSCQSLLVSQENVAEVYPFPLLCSYAHHSGEERSNQIYKSNFSIHSFMVQNTKNSPAAW